MLVRQLHINASKEGLVEQRLVFDVLNKTWFYPDLLHFAGLSREQQIDAIAKLNTEAYGGITDWQMATADQTNAMKESLASMAPQENRIPWDFSHLKLDDKLTPDFNSDARTVGSPRLAWPVHAEDFFVPTEGKDYILFKTIPALVFNGRVDAKPCWRRNPDGTTTWSKGEADDHWMQIQLAQPGVKDTMLYNEDVHFLDDSAKVHEYLVPGVDYLGEVGAWVASTQRPEILHIAVSVDVLGNGTTRVLFLGSPWMNVNQINPHQCQLTTSQGSHKPSDFSVINDNGGGHEMLELVFESGKLDKDNDSWLLSGFFKAEYGGTSFRAAEYNKS